MLVIQLKDLGEYVLFPLKNKLSFKSENHFRTF